VATWEVPRTDAGRYLHDVAVTDGLLYASYLNDGLVILDVGNGIKGGFSIESATRVAVQVRSRLATRRGRVRGNLGDRRDAYGVAAQELCLRW
jgi:hypothetical protein